MEQSLIHLKDKLKKAGFKFEASTSLYNPMERFADYVSTKEIVHSKIIADLLNPAGEHQLGNGFLIKLFQAIGISFTQPHFPEAENPFKSVQVNTEYYAPTVLDDIETKGRIDILVLVELGNNKKYALIIENKLNDAPNQHQQLERYNAYVRDNFKGYDIQTVYMPRIGDHCDYKDAKVINATALAEILDQTLRESVTSNKPAIQAYANYLRNISMNNIIMQNAMELAKMSAEDIMNAEAIKDAYGKLCEAFAAKLKVYYDGNNGLKAEISSGYSKYCYIWNPIDYGKTSLWLAVGFEYGNYWFYILSNNIDHKDYSGYLEKLKIVKTSEDSEGYWHKPIEDNRFKKSFKGKPNFEKLTSEINEWLEKLSEIAGIK